jgi:hypothetical protein
MLDFKTGLCCALLFLGFGFSKKMVFQRILDKGLLSILGLTGIGQYI